MSILQVSRAIIHLGDIKLDVFQLPDLSYRLSSEGCSVAINKPKNHALRFLDSGNVKVLPYKSLREYKLKVDGERTRINPIPFDFAVIYWGKEANAGNSQATELLMACALESLERRADAAFNIDRTEIERNIRFIEFIRRWREVRALARFAHSNMANMVRFKKHPGHLVHDYMTVLIFGDTAAAARLKALVDSDADPKIGLNHQEDIDGMLLLANVKQKYANKTKGTWQEQVESAVKEVLVGK